MNTPHTDILKLKERALTILKQEHTNFLLTGKVFYNVKPVNIAFMTSLHHWGTWSPSDRIISLNERLLTDCHWCTVVGILGHEIAHQLVTDLHPGSNDPPHGPIFQEMANLIYLEPVFRSASVDLEPDKLPPSLFDHQKSQDLPILEKLRKILALAADTQANEASAALAAASRLMARHNIEKPETDQYSQYERCSIPLNTTRINKRILLTGQILQNYFFTKVVFSKIFNPQKNDHFYEFIILGRPSNLAMAEHVYHFLTERSETLWLKYRELAWQHGEKGIQAKTAFIHNLLLGFAENRLSVFKELPTRNQSLD